MKLKRRLQHRKSRETTRNKGTYHQFLLARRNLGLGDVMTPGISLPLSRRSLRSTLLRYLRSVGRRRPHPFCPSNFTWRTRSIRSECGGRTARGMLEIVLRYQRKVTYLLAMTIFLALTKGMVGGGGRGALSAAREQRTLTTTREQGAYSQPLPA